MLTTSQSVTKCNTYGQEEDNGTTACVVCGQDRGHRRRRRDRAAGEQGVDRGKAEVYRHCEASSAAESSDPKVCTAEDQGQEMWQKARSMKASCAVVRAVVDVVTERRSSTVKPKAVQPGLP